MRPQPPDQRAEQSGHLWQAARKTTAVQIGLLVMIWGLSSLMLAGCAFPGSTRPVIKIGLIAPFEGEQRPNGYQRLHGVKLALREVNLGGGVAGYKIELVALNDYADMEESTLQAQELVLDSDIRAVIGQWEPGLYEAAEPIYRAAQLAVVSPARYTDFSGLPATFAADYQTLGGSLPDAQARQAYLATHQLINAIEQAVLTYGSPERAHVLMALNALEQINK